MPKPIRFAISLTFICVFIILLAGFAVFKSYSQGNVDGISVEPTQTVTVVAHMMSGGPISNTSCVVPPSKSIFALTDERAYQWTTFSGISAGDVVRRDFIRPDGTIHFTSPDRFPRSGSSCAWDSIPIAGDQAALFPGNWQARVYYNGALILTEDFTISDGQPTTGAVIIDGTSANRYGSASGGVNQNGWLYMQKALESLAAQVAPGTAKVVVDLGSSNGAARNAINSAFDLSSLKGAGWTLRHEDGAANITNWLTNISTANTGILYITTYNLATGDLTGSEMAAINAQAGRIAAFVNNGGALFAMGEEDTIPMPGSWRWLLALYPGISGSARGSGVNLTLTPDGMAAFPGLTNADLTTTVRWHFYFTGDLGNLKVLAAAPDGANTRQVILGNLRTPPPPPSCPAITGFNPTSGSAGTNVTITGSNFVGVNAVRFSNNVPATFTVSGDTQITVTAPNGAVTGPITISKPNCPDATTAVFTVINPQGPALTALSPNSAIAGGPNFTLTAIGSNFVSGSVVRWNGADRTTTFVSATQLLAEIFASDIGAAGAIPVTVINPPPGGGVSNALDFTITDKPPAGAAVIIDGTDANEHGGVSGGANVRGWLYMQKALENLAARVDPGTAKVVVDLGSSSGTARNAINSAFNLSSLPGAGWQLRHEDGAANITNWLTNISTANTGILYITTYNLTGGDLDAQEMAAINAQAGRIAGFMSLSPGGALFAMGEVGAGSWDWLRALYSGIVVTDVGGGGISSNITLTPDGTTSFPGLTNTDLAGADPWHNYFTGNLGDLKVLATAPQSGATRQVILGGLGIRPNPSPRTVRIVCPPSASRGGTLTLPIELVSEGNENALGFSLNFDPAVLGNPQVALGGDANNATLNMNISQVAQGRLGVGLALPSGQAFAAGVRRIAVVTFAVSAATAATSTAVTFGDAPIRREVSNANAQVLPVIFDGCLNIPIRGGEGDGFEADVAPRPNGSGAVTVTDWVQVGRFAAGLDTVTAGGEFQRADCAPRDTRGDGRLSITDWVQAGRYAAGLDSAQPAGGPSSPSAFAPENVAQAGAENSHGRVIRALNATFQRGQPNTLEIEIEAEGDENALGFSLNFDPTALAFVSASAGVGANGALLNVNESQTANGRLGVALALPAGQTLKAGKQTVVTVRFNSLASSGVATTPISFGDQPIRRELSDVNAVAVAASYSDGSVSVVSSVANVSAASFKPEIAAESIVAAFGASLATATAVTISLPLPTSLAGTTVRVRDSAGVERLAPLFFVAPAQVNYQAPPGTAAGVATVTVTSGNGTISAGTVDIAPVAPSLFGANADGQGVGATVAVRVRADGSQVFENTARFDPALNRLVHEPIDLGPENEQVVLLLFGTGFRNRSALSAVSVSVGGLNMPVDYAGPQPDFAGLDQINVRLLRSLIGRGEVDIVVIVDGKTANTIKAFIK